MPVETNTNLQPTFLEPSPLPPTEEEQVQYNDTDLEQLYRQEQLED